MELRKRQTPWRSFGEGISRFRLPLVLFSVLLVFFAKNLGWSIELGSGAEDCGCLLTAWMNAFRNPDVWWLVFLAPVLYRLLMKDYSAMLYFVPAIVIMLGAGFAFVTYEHAFLVLIASGGVLFLFGRWLMGALAMAGLLILFLLAVLLMLPWEYAGHQPVVLFSSILILWEAFVLNGHVANCTPNTSSARGAWVKYAEKYGRKALPSVVLGLLAPLVVAYQGGFMLLDGLWFALWFAVLLNFLLPAWICWLPTQKN
jgi:hypothetical protein